MCCCIFSLPYLPTLYILSSFPTSCFPPLPHSLYLLVHTPSLPTCYLLSPPYSLVPPPPPRQLPLSLQHSLADSMSIVISLTESQSLSSHGVEDEAARSSLQTTVQVVDCRSVLILRGLCLGPLQSIIHSSSAVQLARESIMRGGREGGGRRERREKG